MTISFSRLAKPVYALRAIAILSLAALVSSCASPTPKASLGYNKNGASLSSGETSEYFSEAAYGVKASPRVATNRSRMRRGGGRYQVGKPYKVKGQWYHPKENENYDKKGRASWYGAAFHGRLTANGEIYDMAQLTAAHPTMPLPSYARVTNLKNGHSLIVRVNDRGPFARDRVIDLSKRAAELLDYTNDGVANVRVQYVGRAPLHGHDDQFLLASYQRGDNLPAGPSGLPGTMVAMADPSLRVRDLPGVGSKSPAYAALAATALARPALSVSRQSSSGIDPVLPAFGPVPPERPVTGLVYAKPKELRLLGYADSRIIANSAFDHLIRDEKTGVPGKLSESAIVESWKRTRVNRDELDSSSIYAGAYQDVEKASAIASSLSGAGSVVVSKEYQNDTAVYVVTLRIGRGQDGNATLRQVWSLGVEDAFFIRNQ